LKVLDFDLTLTGFSLDELSPPDTTAAGIEDAPASKYKEQFGVIVICRDEAHQQEVFESLAGSGLRGSGSRHLMTATRTIRFAKFQTELVASGKKRMTIRASRKDGIEAGDKLRLMGPTRAGPRQRSKAEPLREAVCVGVNDIMLRFSPKTKALISAEISGPVFAGPLNVDALAWADGFADALEMGRFFVKWHGPEPFKGVLIRW
jgi:hypothetical protein